MSISTVDESAAPSSGILPPFNLSSEVEGRDPVRGELLGQERLEAHARQLAKDCVLAPAVRASSPLLRRFADNGRALAEVHKRLVGESAQRPEPGLDAEWLADNYHIVEDVLREAKRDLPRGYDQELPKLAEGVAPGYPRVYAMALSLVAHSDSAVDEARLTRFVQAFQEGAPLTIGEFWALPTMVRLALIENLRRLAEQVLWGWDERQRAEAWVDAVLAAGPAAGEAGATGGSPPPLPAVTEPFVVRLLQRLREHEPSAETLAWIDQQLQARGVDGNEVIRREHRRQAANQVSVGNCVISLRLLSAVDWHAFVERLSAVEAILRQDPAGYHALQDFATRDRYRREVEKIARGTGDDTKEVSVARRALAMAQEARARGEEMARTHVGYYLIDRGQISLKAEFQVKESLRERVIEAMLAYPRTTYFGGVAIFAVALLGILTSPWAVGAITFWQFLLLFLALLLPVSELAVGLVNHVLTLVLPPRVLPKLEFKDGISAECATFVVMPSMLARVGSGEMLAQRLEIHFLANPDPQFRFALLTDFSDADAENRPEDEAHVREALASLKALNDKYATPGEPKFFLFHRRRQWNSVQGCWMGWERKRGKLLEFNRLLRGDKATSYSVQSDDLASVPKIRYVLTLDADTQLPRDSATRLLGAIAHPLNQPRFDPALGRVVEGHGVLQPRVSFHLTAATHSRFAAVLAASGGIDPYSAAASDTYMDLFGVGSFTGKGIYDVDAFESATGHTFPENRILSHDLIEGNYARCGLLTDTELFDDFPARYHAYARREHRWVRGDWQLLPWLGRTVPTPAGQRENPLPTFERWKLLDNLRRSLVAPALVLLLALGWTVLPGSPWLWTATVIAVPMLPLLQQLVAVITGCLRTRSLAGFKRTRDFVPAGIAQAALALTFLADQARQAIDATVRTLVRLLVTRRRMLEWETAASTERRLGTGLKSFLWNMWPAAALAIALGGIVTVMRPEALGAALPVLLAWALSPVVAFWVSQPRPEMRSPLTAAERREMRRIARRTWYFFETFVGDEDHWLPPDNFQEEPLGRVAHRTSPTNKGLLLLSTLAANDLGYIGLRALAERLEKTFDTFDQMEKHWGHFYNWYNTSTLKPMTPLYVSTVDSGNMLGCLVALKQGLIEKANGPLVGSEVAEGLADALGLAEEIYRKVHSPRGESSAAYRAVGEEFEKIRRRLENGPADMLGWDTWLGELDWSSIGLIAKIRTLRTEIGDVPGEMEAWAQKFSSQLRGKRAELDSLAPWLSVLRDIEAQGGPKFSAEEPAARWREIRSTLVDPRGVGSKASSIREGLLALQELATPAPKGPKLLAEAIEQSTAADLKERLLRLARRAEVLGDAMEFQPLYRPERHLYAIGCNLVQGRLDSACYDLLASESCLTSYLTIARGEAPRRHWFQLGRPYIRAAGRIGLVSWGGTMFEYMMPRLLLRSLPGTLVSESCMTALARQIEYGRQSSVPWGISESSYFDMHAEGDYHYQSFGVPGLGLKRGLEDDLVIAPYATALAAEIAPHEALANLRRLAEEGGLGPYGFYEALDFTSQRVPKGRRCGVVRSYMAHHQGMSLVAYTNAVLDDPMPRRFHNDPVVRAAELLLQERIPRDAPVIEPSEAAATQTPVERETVPLLSRRLTTAHTPAPRTHLISNGRYHVMVTNAGSGYSAFEGMAVTRWQEDATRDDWGQYFYLRDAEGGAVWSAGYQPTRRPADGYEVTFAADKAVFRRTDGKIETALEVTVSLEEPAEVRRLIVTNRDVRSRVIEITSYVEVVLLPRAADLAHPAFGKLFLETEWIEASESLLCRRRPRGKDESPVWAVHVSSVEGTVEGTVQYETDRARFLGRGRTTADPEALDHEVALSGTTGPVLDPIFSVRRRIRIEPGEMASIAYTTAVAQSREQALALADQFREPSAVARAFELTWAQSQVEHRHRSRQPDEAHLFQRLAASLLYAGSALRAPHAVIAANRRGQSDLWQYGVSGDFPILLARIATAEELPLARQLLDAHADLRQKGLTFEMVFLSDPPSGYADAVRPELHEMIRASDSSALSDQRGGIFVRGAAEMPEADLILLQSVARVVLVGDRGGLAAQLDHFERAPVLPPPLAPTRENPDPAIDESLPPAGLLFDNGLGGFTPDGREYVISVRGSEGPSVRRNGKPYPDPRRLPVLPPAPWINIIANPNCGFLVSEAGSGYTWAVNSQSNRLTPWMNDPVSDPAVEAIYVRDEETGVYWSPTPQPVLSGEATIVRHGQGYTTFERAAHALVHELTVFVPPTDPVKVLLLTIRNPGERARRLSATFYSEWVLGTTRELSAPHVVTELDLETGTLLARNNYRQDFGERVAFADTSRRPRTLTGDRAEFLGRNGTPAAPAALHRLELSGRVGAAYDPCAAIQTTFDLAPGAETTIVFLIGEAEHADAVRELVRRYREPRQAVAALQDAKRVWEDLAGAVQVTTPEPGLDLLVNHWLLYQVLSCRVWGRSAFYQSGGAYGFRDQLQDVMALTVAAPSEARAQILRAAARQFVEGDVQHWWHPPVGRGIRTRFSDDFLWLPYVVAHYVSVTGDTALLDERIAYLQAPALKPGQDEDYGLPSVSGESGTLYDHCVRALEHAGKRGVHGLPLMGTGDWNDGMNRVGVEGRGESVWDAWFLMTILGQFAGLSRSRGDVERADRCLADAEALRAAVEGTAWDGAWYRRAYFDDGTPLGSSQNDECQIDAIAQAWGVMSGMADVERTRKALESVEERLVRNDDRLILLLAPPFGAGTLSPGYIKGYLPGIRENGGQYTHAATWVVLATALSGQGRRALELFNYLNPIHHTADPASVRRYKVEPYVLAGDVYSMPPHTGRGGWTWYSGSAGWLYRVALESLLGFQLSGQTLAIDPCISPAWPRFEMRFRHGSATYHIVVENPDGVERGVRSVSLDGQALEARSIGLADDGQTHEVAVRLGN